MIDHTLTPETYNLKCFMFLIDDRDDVEFDELGETGKCLELFKKSLLYKEFFF